MKKIAILAAIISTCSLINANQPQKGSSLDEYLEYLRTSPISASEVPLHISQLNKARQDQESKLPVEIKKQIAETIEKIATEQLEASTADLKALTDAALGFDLAAKSRECANNNKKACTELEERAKNLKVLKKLVKHRSELRQIYIISASKEVLESFEKNSPETRLFLKQMQAINERIEHLTALQQMHNQ